MPFAGPVSEVSSLVSGSESSLREATCIAASCHRFARPFSGSLQSVHCLRLYRVASGPERAVFYSVCTLYRG